MNNAHWQQNRGVVERIIVEGDLILETPASLSNGERDVVTNAPLLLDPLEGYALLTGTSLAGALRNYLREREVGYGQTDQAGSLCVQLFGGLRQNDEGQQSPLITYDALSTARPITELRDGVKLDPKTRTAENRKKFDVEILEADTIFPIRVELLVIKGHEQALTRGLAIALQGFEKCEIYLGGRKRRGLGRCRVKEWRVYRYNLTQASGLIDWLDNTGEPQTGSDIATLLSLDSRDFPDERRSFSIKATFALDSSLLIRSGSGEAAAPDMVHLHSSRGGKTVPVLSGTSLAGALRARAERIVKTIGQDKSLVETMFGPVIEPGKKPSASRVVVGEGEIGDGVDDLIQSRVKIDRFTGGSYPGALFNQQPVFGRVNGQTAVSIDLVLRAAAGDNKYFEAEIGLLLLLLKDLWTGDLPLGGEASVGRGRLQGLSAELKLDEQQSWRLKQTAAGVAIEEGDEAGLEKFVQALREVVL